MQNGEVPNNLKTIDEIGILRFVRKSRTKINLDREKSTGLWLRSSLG
jgi:hypothetical protein